MKFLGLVDMNLMTFFTTALLQQHEAIHLNCLRNAAMQVLENHFSQCIVNI